MANLSQIRRKKMLEFLETLKEQHTDDASLIAINQIERELTAKKYGLVWEEHEEEVDVKMQTHIPVFTEVEDKEIVGDPENEQYNFLLEGDNLHSLKLLEKTHKGKIDVLIHHIILEVRILFITMHRFHMKILLDTVNGCRLWQPVLKVQRNC